MLKFVLTNIIILILMFIRRPGGFLTPTLYFEDGATFLNQQLQMDSWRLIFTPFTHGTLGDSYFLFLTRLVTFFTSKLPIYFAPYLMNGVGFLITSLSISTFTLPRFKTVVKDDYLRILFAILAATVLDGGEFFGTTTNFFWPLGIVIVYHLILPTPNAIDKDAIDKDRYLYFKTLIFTAIALSTPLSGLLLPFSFLKIVFNKFRNAIPLVGFVIGGSVELLVNFLCSTGNKGEKYIPESPVLLESLRNGFAHHVTLPMLFGYDVSKELMKNSIGIEFFYVIFFCIIFAIFLTAKKEVNKLKTILFLLIICFLNYSLSYFKRDLWSFFYSLGDLFFWDAPRYFFLSRVCLALIIFITIDSLVNSKILKVVITSGLFALVFINEFKLKEPEADPKLDWSLQYQQISKWILDSRHGIAEQISVPVYPAPIWKIQLPASNFSKNTEWNWGDRIDSDADSVILLESNPLTWKDLLVLDDTHSNFVVTSEYRCNVPDKSLVVMKVTDIFGGEIESTRMKYFKCGRIKDISIRLPKGPRRGVRISFEYEGERSVKLSNLRTTNW